jgi:hypothetical protein
VVFQEFAVTAVGLQFWTMGQTGALCPWETKRLDVSGLAEPATPAPPAA